MNQRRIAFAVTKCFPFGGMQRTMLRIAQECTNRGHQLVIFTGQWQGKIPNNIQVRELDIRALTNQGKNIKLANKLNNIVNKKNFDCIVGFTKIPGLDIYYAGDPCFAAKFIESKPLIFRILPRYRAFLKQEASVFERGRNTEILLIAHQEKEKFISAYGTESQRFHLLPPGIDKTRLTSQIPEKSERRRLRQTLGIADDQIFILTVGSGFRTKGVDRSISALNALPDTLRRKSFLVIVGEGDKKRFMNQAKKLGITEQVIFTGPRPDVALFYYSANLLLHPPYTENTGTTIIEAMICGLPVVATANCGFAFHLKNADAGMVCPAPFEQSTLNNCLTEALTSTITQKWRDNGPCYCDRTDLYSLIEKAADIIIARAEANAARQ